MYIQYIYIYIYIYINIYIIPYLNTYTYNKCRNIPRNPVAEVRMPTYIHHIYKYINHNAPSNQVTTPKSNTNFMVFFCIFIFLSSYFF